MTAKKKEPEVLRKSKKSRFENLKTPTTCRIMIIRDILLILLVEMIRTANENEHFLNQKIKKNLKRFCLFYKRKNVKRRVVIGTMGDVRMDSRSNASYIGIFSEFYSIFPKCMRYDHYSL